MKDWWQTLQLREKILLGCVALVVGLVLVDSLIIESYRLKHSQLSENVEQAQEDLDWMRGAVDRLSAAQRPAARRFSGRIVSFVDQQIQRQGLKDKMQQMTPIQNHSVRVRLQDVAFTRLLNFFSAIDGAVLVEEVRILPGDVQGQVNASLIVSIAGAGS